ncbi:hypothetical protein [Micromonospora sp. KC723]|uniref:hypothetical protein n=1 Tax=Micromonospora sp. KC723 TaxID=2530381 RepID=UPI00104BAA52|nr:hypothetical protein [Micromonospora sp. KC723]TDB74269.1 hypothetical protein E1165_14950 [Micromonospora sp. KC723]
MVRHVEYLARRHSTGGPAGERDCRIASTCCDALRDRGAFAATGVRGAYSDILPADALRDATTSIYAEIGIISAGWNWIGP